jgi:hypothetical protein
MIDSLCMLLNHNDYQFTVHPQPFKTARLMGSIIAEDKKSPSGYRHTPIEALRYGTFWKVLPPIPPLQEGSLILCTIFATQ